MRISEFIMNRDKYKVDSTYQRPADAWSRKDKQCLIDTIMRGEPVPLFFLNYITEEDVNSGEEWEEEDAVEAMLSLRRGKAKSSAHMDECHAEMMFGAAEKTQSLEDELKQMYTDSFEKHLQQLINKKGLKNSEIYAAANISKQYFSKLLKGQVKPSKEKVLSLAVGLRLNLDETVDFLRLAGYAL